MSLSYAKYQVKKTCFGAGIKLHEQRKTQTSYEFTLQFGYFPLVWMFHGQTLNNRINKLQVRALRLVYNDSSSFS